MFLYGHFLRNVENKALTNWVNYQVCDQKVELGSLQNVEIGIINIQI